MAGPKKSLPAPIDRPLSRAYLRKFTGWSTAFPPGMSEPSSLRKMHNCSVTQDGALRIRPGLRRVFTAPADGDIVGTFEHFYLDGTDGPIKALLFAVRETDGSVGFRVAKESETTGMFEVVHVDTIFNRGQEDLNFERPGTNKGHVSYVKYVQIDNKILALSDNEEAFRLFLVGASKVARVIKTVTRPNYDVNDRLRTGMPSIGWINGAQNTVPTMGDVTDDRLHSSDSAKNVYTFAYFYTFNNDVGESAPSMIDTIKVQRRWTAWRVDPSLDTKSHDQIGVFMLEDVFNAAKAQGALSWNLYYLTWGPQDAVPVEGILLKTIPMEGKTYQQAGWATHTPLLQGVDAVKPLPSINRLDNFTEPSTAGQGLVAGDRMVLVYDALNAARIKWSSNLQGDYLNFSASKGGGYKTLTTGNLFTPAAVKLWQNPQSVDTLVVLCKGLDGYGAAYYMNPSSKVNAQNQSVNIMGFEETTATPGTVSPYGCEVLNNALYHPLENSLMKSTAANYNINHLLMTDKIANVWSQVPLADKEKIVSAQMDSTLYYLVQSKLGRIDSPNSNGNQIWLCDTGNSGVWSCWDVAGTALRKLELHGLLYMGITSGRNIYVFDPEQDHDDVWEDGAWTTVGIPWEVATNTQGANRAHDAWALLQQLTVTFGNFTGECVYGIRGKDVNGMPVEISKHYASPERSHDPLVRYDMEDHLQVRRIMKEWEFFWSSAPRPKNRSYGAVNFVQYRYTPASVNNGYEFGSVETFEYGSRDLMYSNGVPVPQADTSTP